MENNENKALESANAEHDAQLPESRVPGQVVCADSTSTATLRESPASCGVRLSLQTVMSFGEVFSESCEFASRLLPPLVAPPNLPTH
jgi:hypothetical protein